MPTPEKEAKLIINGVHFAAGRMLRLPVFSSAVPLSQWAF